MLQFDCPGSSCSMQGCNVCAGGEVNMAVVFSVEQVQAETHSFNTESFMGWV